MRVSLSKPRKGRPKQVYRLRAHEHGRVVTDPDGTVSSVGRPGKIQITGVYKEPFASLFAEPFDAERMVRAVMALGTTDRERIRELNARLKKSPPRSK